MWKWVHGSLSEDKDNNADACHTSSDNDDEFTDLMTYWWSMACEQFFCFISSSDFFTAIPPQLGLLWSDSTVASLHQFHYNVTFPSHAEHFFYNIYIIFATPGHPPRDQFNHYFFGHDMPFALQFTLYNQCLVLFLNPSNDLNSNVSCIVWSLTNPKISAI